MYLYGKPYYWTVFTFLLVNTFSHVRLTRAKGTNPRAKHIGHIIRCNSEMEALISVCCVFRPQICGSDEMKRPTMITAQQIPRPGETPDEQIQWKDVNVFIKKTMYSFEGKVMMTRLQIVKVAYFCHYMYKLMEINCKCIMAHFCPYMQGIFLKIKSSCKIIMSKCNMDLFTCK